MRLQRVGRGLAGVGLFALGCANPNVYGTPRTLPPGKAAFVAALDGVAYSIRTKKLLPENPYYNTKFEDNGFWVLPPTFALRIGVANRLDLGLKFANASTPGLDLKLNFLKTEAFDLALAPGAEYTLATASRVHLPLLAGINLSDQLTLVLVPGVTYAKSHLPDLFDVSTIRAIVAAEGWYGRLGLGLAIRLNKKVALQPELGVLKAFRPPRDLPFERILIFNAGIGVTLGAQPEYGPPEEPAAPPKPATPPPVVVVPSAAPPPPPPPPPEPSQRPLDAPPGH